MRTVAVAPVWYRWIVGIGLLIILVVVVGPATLVETVRRWSLPWAITVSCVIIVWLGMGAINVWILLRRLTSVRLSAFMPAYLCGWASSLLLPGQLGDAVQVVFLRRHGIPMATSSAAYIVDKAISMAWTIVVSSVGLGLYGIGIAGWWLAILPLISGGAILVVFRIFWGIQNPRFEPLQRMARRLVAELKRFRTASTTVVLNASLTVVKWSLVSIAYWCAFAAIKSPVDLKAAATIPMMSSLVGYLPVSIGGAGTTEIAAIFVFEQAGTDGASVLAVYLFFRILLLTLALIVLVLSGSNKKTGPTDVGPAEIVE